MQEVSYDDKHMLVSNQLTVIDSYWNWITYTVEIILLGIMQKARFLKEAFLPLPTPSLFMPARQAKGKYEAKLEGGRG